MWQRTDPPQFRAYYMLSVGIKVPIYRSRKQRPELAQAESEQLRARSELQAQSQQLAGDLPLAICDRPADLRTAQDFTREGLSPQARSEFQAGIAAYQSNKQDFQALLTAFLSMYCNLDEDYWQKHGRIRDCRRAHRAASLDCHCMTRERNDENVSHWIFGGIDWKRRAWRRPRWLWLHYRAVKPMAFPETKMANSTRRILWPTRWPHPLHRQKHRWFRCRSLRSACRVSGSRPARSNGNQSQTRFAPPAVSLWTKGELAYVQVRFSGYIQKVFAECHLPICPERAAAIHSYSPELVATEREYLVAKQNQQASGAEYGARCRPQRSIAARRGCGASQAVGRSAKRNHSPRIHRPSAAGLESIRRSWLHHRAQIALPVLPLDSRRVISFWRNAPLLETLRSRVEQRCCAEGDTLHRTLRHLLLILLGH